MVTRDLKEVAPSVLDRGAYLCPLPTNPGGVDRTWTLEVNGRMGEALLVEGVGR